MNKACGPFCAHHPHDTCCCSQPGHGPHLHDRTIHAAAMWPCATRAHVRYAHTTVEHHNYTFCCKHSTLAHHALLQHRDAPPHRRRRRKFPHPARKGARAFGPPPARHTTLAPSCNALLAAHATVSRLWYSLGQSLPGPRPNQRTNFTASQARAKRRAHPA